MSVVFSVPSFPSSPRLVAHLSHLPHPHDLDNEKTMMQEGYKVDEWSWDDGYGDSGLDFGNNGEYEQALLNSLTSGGTSAIPSSCASLLTARFSHYAI